MCIIFYCVAVDPLLFLNSDSPAITVLLASFNSSTNRNAQRNLVKKAKQVEKIKSERKAVGFESLNLSKSDVWFCFQI